MEERGQPVAGTAVGAVPWKPCDLVSLPLVTCTYKAHYYTHSLHRIMIIIHNTHAFQSMLS